MGELEKTLNPMRGGGGGMMGGGTLGSESVHSAIIISSIAQSSMNRTLGDVMVVNGWMKRRC